jgi:hypothetical protein
MLIEMKLSPWKIAVLGMEKPPVGVRTFCPLSMLVFYIPPCWKCPPECRNVKNTNDPHPCWFLHSSMPKMSEEMLIFNILYSHAI